MQSSGNNSVTDAGVSIIFFGTEDFSLAALRTLVSEGFSVALVVTKPDNHKGRGMTLSEPVVKTYAREHGIEVLQPFTLRDVATAISAVANRIGVLSSYGKIIPQSILDLFERGIVNIHPSLLPNYRGPSPIETTIMNGDVKTGVSLMRLVAAMDAGPIYLQQTVELPHDAYAGSLYTLLAQTGAQLLVESLPRIITGSLEARDQDEATATYTNLLNKKGALVDPATMGAEAIERHVRAYEIYPRTKMTINSHEVIIVRARVADDGALKVTCKDNSVLSIDELIAPSGKRLTGAEFLRGYQK